MLRLTVAPQRESVLVVAQTRDRNGHAANPSDPTDATVYGTTPALGYAAQPADSTPAYPLFDLDRDGTFGAIEVEQDIDGDPALPGFYDVTQELAAGDAAADWPAEDPNDSTRTLWLYVGREFAFRSIYFGLSVPAVFTSAVLEAQYWNGSAWTTLTLTEGDQLDTLQGVSDQVSWDRLGDWFPRTIENQLVTAEGSRRVLRRDLFWVRVRLSSIVGLTQAPQLSGLWEGEPDAESDLTLWLNVARPEKAVILRGSMLRDPNAHLASSLVASRKQPAEIDAGTVDLGRGDYYVQIPTGIAEDDVVGKDPGATEYRCTGTNKFGTSVTVQVPSRAVIRRPGRYRIRVYGEIPNLDASVFAGDSGHTPFVPDPALTNPDDPESQFDPTWNPVLTAMSASFDVRAKNAFAQVEMTRNASGTDTYTLWLQEDGLRARLANQVTPDYARLIVHDATTGAVLIDTMVSGKRDGTAGALNPQAGVSGSDIDAFRYTESNNARKLQDRGQYHVTAMIVRGEEAFISRVVLNFFA